MDSLTQVVLGAAVGEAVLGKKVGNRAMFYGAIAGTIPDLDVLASNFVETSRALEFHRGFTHSIAFSLFFAPIFAWIVTRYDKHKDLKGWTLLFFWAFFTHPILDAHTTWGTQLFWPLDARLAWKTIFVIDPLYTIPFLTLLVLAMFRRREDPKRSHFNNLGLIVSSSYLALTFLLKFIATSQFEKALEEQNIAYVDIETRPSPMNTILWGANVDAEDAYLLGDYSFFDSQPIRFTSYAKDHHVLGELVKAENLQRMIKISKGWYIISEEEGQLYFNDLRFGVYGFPDGSDNFVFNMPLPRMKMARSPFRKLIVQYLIQRNYWANLAKRVMGN